MQILMKQSRRKKEMIKIIVDKIPNEAKECSFAEYIAITNKHCCMFQKFWTQDAIWNVMF